MDFTVFLEAIAFGLVVGLIIVGLIGIIVPLIPGTFLIWLSVLVYAIVEGFDTIDWITFTVISIIALVTGTADLWMSLLGARTGGASKRAIAYGIVGSIAGLIILSPIFPPLGSIFGGIIGYSIGVLLGQFHKHNDWNIAIKASLGGLAGWGIATVIQLAGALMILIIFVWQVLKG
jgi:uncharacterized protein YqgC (DUF456 family)